MENGLTSRKWTLVKVIPINLADAEARVPLTEPRSVKSGAAGGTPSNSGTLFR